MIRQLKRSDKEEYISMCMDFYSGGAVLKPIPRENIERTFEQLMSGTPYAVCYINERDGKTAGYLLTAETWSQEGGGPVCWIEEIYAKPEFRGCGIGSELIKHVLSQKKYARFRLETEPDNSRAVKLYRRCGFDDMGYIPYVLDVLSND